MNFFNYINLIFNILPLYIIIYRIIFNSIKILIYRGGFMKKLIKLYISTILTIYTIFIIIASSTPYIAISNIRHNSIFDTNLDKSINLRLWRF